MNIAKASQAASTGDRLLLLRTMQRWSGSSWPRFTPLWTSGIQAPAELAIGVTAFLLLVFWRVPLWLVLILGGRPPHHGSAGAIVGWVLGGGGRACLVWVHPTSFSAPPGPPRP